MPHIPSLRNLMTVVPTVAALVAFTAACGDDTPADGANQVPTVQPTTVPVTSAPVTSAPVTTEPVTTEPSNEGGFGAPAAAAGEFGQLPGVAMVGNAELADNGCWYLSGNGETALLVAPTGTQLGDDGVTLVTADGIVIADGSPIETRGGLVAFTDLPGGPDGKWGNYATFCAPTYEVVVVADTLTLAYDPAGADLAALAAELDSSVFDTDYGCGFGFATGDADGKWALHVDIRTDSPPAAGLVDLPDERFQVTVTAGANLFSNHCDDVMEWFEPSPSEAAVWDVTAGQFTYPETSAEWCAGGPPVTITLTDASVDTPAGLVLLDPIEITNTSFGCFAG
jgi:hypothetical protein